MEQLGDFFTHPLVLALLAMVAVVGTAASVWSLIIALRQSARTKDIEQREEKLALPPEFLDGLPDAVNKKLRAAYQEARLLQLEGYEAQSAEKHQEAIDRFTRALELAENDSQRAALHNLRGNSYQSMSQYKEAQEDYEEVIKLSESIARPEDAADAHTAALGNLGAIYGQRGVLEEAEKFLRQALEKCRETGNHLDEATNLNNLGIVYRQRGHLNKAKRHLADALRIDRETNNRGGEARDLVNLGNVYLARGGLDKADDHFRQALEINRKIGNRLGEAQALDNLGTVYGRCGELHKAEKLFTQALNLHRKTRNRLGEASTLGNLGLVCLQRGDTRHAKPSLQQAQVIFQQIGAGGQGPENVRRALEELERWQQERGE